MPFLVIFKRFEVWMLLLVVVALLFFAFQPESDPAGAFPGREAGLTNLPDPDNNTLPKHSGDPPSTDPGGRLMVREVRVTESPGGRIVETTLSGRAPGGADLSLDAANVSATTDAGNPVNRFFEPFHEPPLLLASEDTIATLRWWLEGPADTIWLEIRGKRVRADLP